MSSAFERMMQRSAEAGAAVGRLTVGSSYNNGDEVDEEEEPEVTADEEYKNTPGYKQRERQRQAQLYGGGVCGC